MIYHTLIHDSYSSSDARLWATISFEEKLSWEIKVTQAGSIFLRQQFSNSCFLLSSMRPHPPSAPAPPRRFALADSLVGATGWSQVYQQAFNFSIQCVASVLHSCRTTFLNSVKCFNDILILSYSQMLRSSVVIRISVVKLSNLNTGQHDSSITYPWPLQGNLHLYSAALDLRENKVLKWHCLAYRES